MKEKDVVKDSHFEGYGEVRVDAKNRITLGKKGAVDATSYKVYRNSLGQIILDPQVSIPAHEARQGKLIKVPKALLKEGYKVMAEESKRVMNDFEQLDRDSLKYVD